MWPLKELLKIRLRIQSEIFFFPLKYPHLPYFYVLRCNKTVIKSTQNHGLHVMSIVMVRTIKHQYIERRESDVTSTLVYFCQNKHNNR